MRIVVMSGGLSLGDFLKVKYYKERNKSAVDSWEESVYRRFERLFRIHNVYWHIGWLECFTGEHPEVLATRALRMIVLIMSCQPFILSTVHMRLLCSESKSWGRLSGGMIENTLA